MRIIFFGTSHGVPEPNRRCSSIMIEVKNNRYFIDMGTQSIENLATLGISVETVRAVFVTHMHPDHTNGLVSFLGMYPGRLVGTKPDIYLPADVEKCVSAINAWRACNEGGPLIGFKFERVSDGFFYDDGIIRISAYRTRHNDDSFSYVLESEGKRVYFSGDLGYLEKYPNPLEDFPLDEFDRGFDLAVLELAHFWAKDKYYPLLKDRDNVKKLCFTHCCPTRISSVYELMKMLPDQKIVFANDGMEFTI